MRLNVILSVFLAFLLAVSCQSPNQDGANSVSPAGPDTTGQRQAIAALLDSFNATAARSDYEGYFSYFTEDATFLGTDATEHWDKAAFKTWAKPYFDKKTTWHFTALQRHIYFGTSDDLAWFDELLKTSMKICRGSGVVVKKDGIWKVQQYVLSMTFPNEKIDDVLPIKAPIEDSLMKVLEGK